MVTGHCSVGTKGGPDPGSWSLTCWPWLGSCMDFQTVEAIRAVKCLGALRPAWHPFRRWGCCWAWAKFGEGHWSQWFRPWTLETCLGNHGVKGWQTGEEALCGSVEWGLGAWEWTRLSGRCALGWSIQWIIVAGGFFFFFSQFTFIAPCRILYTLPLQLNGSSNIHITEILNGKII